MATWLITGASSGLGRALAEHLLNCGHQVAATARDPRTLEELGESYPDTALTLELDLTDPATITAAVATTQEKFGQIDVLVNNAGYGYIAAIEEGQSDDVARLFQTNLFGPIALIKAVLPAMRMRRQGTIVNISSIGARAPIPGGGYYAAAKAALEGLSGALRQEVEPLGLHVLVVEPGSFRTDFRGRSADHSPTSIKDYDEVLGRNGTNGLAAQRGEPSRAAKAIRQAVEHPSPPSLLLLGTDALAGFRDAAADTAAEVDTFLHLTRSTDA